MTATSQETPAPQHRASQYNAPNRSVTAPDGTTYAYRRFGEPGTTPLVFLQHFRGNLDGWDPALIDPIAAEREVILVDNAGVGLSTGRTAHTVAELARDILNFLDAIDEPTVDLLGFSAGGFVAQQIALQRPAMVRRLVLAGTGPEGGRGFHTWSAEIRAHAFRDVQGAEDALYLFFSPTETSQAKGAEFLGRIFTRTDGRDVTPTLAARDAQGDAIADWGIPDHSKLGRLAAIGQPTLVANGDHDIMVPTVNSYLLAGHIPNARLVIYPDSGHGFLFQYPEQFAAEVNDFLPAEPS